MENQPFSRWLLERVITTEFFMNTLTMVLVNTYCGMMIMEKAPPNEFTILVGMTVGFYFKKG